MTNTSQGTGDASQGAALTRRRLLGLAPLAGAAMALAGCGYTLAGRGSFLPDYIQSIGIPLFINRTPYFTVEQIFTEKVRVAFQSRGRYSVLPVDTGVDGIVRGTIMNISAAPASFTQQQQATRYRFTIVVGVSFEDAKQQKTLWENPALSFSDEYELASALDAGITASTFLDQERAAIERLSTDFGRSVVSAILEAF